MPTFTRLSDDELKAQLKKLQKRVAFAGRSARSNELQHDLQVHEIELEMQNRELRETQQDLQAARDRYADLYDFAPVGYMTLDARGKIREINLTGATMLGFARRDIIEQPFVSWLARAADISAFFSHLRRVTQTRQRAAVELRVKGRDRKLLTVRLESIASSGATGGCRTVMTDITEMKQREQAERERDAEFAHLARVSTLGAMASTIAHEITQPLSAIVSYATTALLSMQKKPGELKPVADALEKVLALGQRAGEIVHSISDFSRKGDLLRAPLELNDVVQGAVLLLTAAARRAGIEIELDLDPNLPKVIGNEVQLEQVIVNLSMNAIESIEACDNGLRKVTVRTARRGDVVHLTVTDTGGGLPPDVAERMFRSFFTTKANGHGMGLALCQTIIRAHDGDIWATPGPAGGAVVTFSIPINRREPAGATDADAGRATRRTS
ncbi:MAG: sensor histidine kinase [Sulfurifustis sp.]